MSQPSNKYAFFKKQAAAAVTPHGVAGAESTTQQQQLQSQQQQSYPSSTSSHLSSSTSSSHSSGPNGLNLAHEVAPRNPFVAQGPGALQQQHGVQPVAIPPRQSQTQTHARAPSDDDDSSDRRLRRRAASPSAAEPSVLPAAFPTNVGPSPRAAAAHARNSKVNAVNTPGGNNVVFQLAQSPKGTVSAAAAAAAAAALHSSHNPSSHSNGYSFSAAVVPQNPFTNGGAGSGGGGAQGTARKRKHSDPDVHASLLGRPRFGAGAAPHRSLGAKLRGVMTAPFRAVWGLFKGKDMKKDDDASASAGLAGPQPSPRSHFARKIGQELGATSKRGGGVCSWKNLLFLIFMSLLAGGVYLWATHECDDGPDSYIDAHDEGAHEVEGGHTHAELNAPLNPASEPGGVVASWLSSAPGSLQEVEQRYPFLHPVLHFFKRPVDHSAHAHRHVASITQPEVPFTLVSLLRDMTPEFLAENKASYIFQYNALLSWVRLTPHVIVYMDSQDSCTSLTSRDEFKSVKCFAVPCMDESVGRPLLNCIFDHSHRESTTEAMGFVNGDIVLSPSVRPLVNKIGNEFQKYLVVSRRTDTHLPEWLIDAYIANYHARANSDATGTPFTPAMATDPEGQAKARVVSDNVEDAMEWASSAGVLHSEFGIDLFLYPKSTFQWMFPAFPPFLAGVYRWDNYFLTKMILHPSVATIDASQFGLLVHQQVDGGKDHSKRTGAAINDALVKQHLGNVYKLGHIKNVDYVLRGGCPQECEISPNDEASVQVLYAKRANAANWMAIIHVAAGEHVELNNFICWANRISFRSFIFLTRDRSMYDEIIARELPAIFLDRTLVDQPLPNGAPPSQSDVESAASVLQRYDFLFSVLKAGYHFFYSSVRAIYLDDPLLALSSSPVTNDGSVAPLQSGVEYFDVQMRGNATWVASPPHAGPIAMRSTNYGQYFWKQVHDCADMNKHIADPAQWIDCVAHNWRVLKGGVKKGLLNPFKFTDAHQFFEEKYSLTHGHYPTMIDDQSVKDNVDKFARLQSWGLLASHASSPVCKDDLPHHRAAVFKPPTDKAEQEFRLKVRVLTFNRWASLKRLLDVLQTAHYDNDRVDLEISIDYPTNMTDKPTIDEWTQTQLTARSFVWSHGSVEVIQQRTHIGLTGQWTQGWYPAADNKEIQLFLEDDTGVSPYYYRWCKRMIQTYYLDPANYDPNLYGFALQTQHTILGETLEGRYGTRQVPDLLNATAQARGLSGIDTEYFRYQLVGTWGGVFFPQHWREFLIWLREKQFIHAEGTSPIFKPCVPTMTSNAWWAKKPHKVWSQWFVRFAFEKGWYNLYTNFPDQLSLVGNFREGGENFAVTKGLMNDMVDQYNTPPGSELYERIHHAPLPVPSSRIPLYDLHFNEVAHPASLRNRLAVWGNPNNIDQCLTMAELAKKKKDAANKIKAQELKLKKEAEARAKEAKGLAAAENARLAKLQGTMDKLQAKNKADDAKKAATATAAADKKKSDVKAADDKKKKGTAPSGAGKAGDKKKKTAGGKKKSASKKNKKKSASKKKKKKSTGKKSAAAAAAAKKKKEAEAAAKKKAAAAAAAAAKKKKEEEEEAEASSADGEAEVEAETEAPSEEAAESTEETTEAPANE